jgi:hypothetical protein
MRICEGAEWVVASGSGRAARGRWSLDRRELPDGPGSRRNRRPSGVLTGFHLTPTAASDNLQH